MRRLSLFLILIVLLSACSLQLTHKPTPSQMIQTQQAVQLAGTVRPWELDFTAVAARHEAGVRFLVLSAIGIKLMDVGIWPERTEVYFQQEKFPAVAVHAFVRFARTAFVDDCTKENLIFKDTRTRATFEVQTVGENKCL